MSVHCNRQTYDIFQPYNAVNLIHTSSTQKIDARRKKTDRLDKKTSKEHLSNEIKSFVGYLENSIRIRRHPNIRKTFVPDHMRAGNMSSFSSFSKATNRKIGEFDRPIIRESVHSFSDCLTASLITEHDLSDLGSDQLFSGSDCMWSDPLSSTWRNNTPSNRSSARSTTSGLTSASWDTVLSTSSSSWIAHTKKRVRKRSEGSDAQSGSQELRSRDHVVVVTTRPSSAVSFRSYSASSRSSTSPSSISPFHPSRSSSCILQRAYREPFRPISATAFFKIKEESLKDEKKRQEQQRALLKSAREQDIYNHVHLMQELDRFEERIKRDYAEETTE